MVPPFSLMYVTLLCPSCKEPVLIGLSKPIMEYGFVCPYCDSITSADSMWLAYLESSPYNVNED